jgi:hypothetical protein
MSNGQGSTRMGESERGPNKGEAYGVAAVTQLFQGVHFPVVKDELVRRFGREQIQWTKEGETYRLEECLREIRRNEFNSITEVTAAISDAVKQGARR